jgi:hypothetical protein
MAKQKYEEKKVIDVVGILDKVDDRYVIMVNNEEYDLLELVEKCLGSVVHLNSEDVLEDKED